MNMFNTSQDSNTNLYYASLKREEGKRPYFRVAQKKGDEFIERDEKINRIEGRLVKTTHTEKEYKGDKVNLVKIHLKDSENYCVLNINFGFFSQYFLNSLISLNGNENIIIFADNTREGYLRLGIINKETRRSVEWKKSKEFIEKLRKEVIVGDKKIYDTTEFNKFFITEINELSKRVDISKKTNNIDNNQVEKSSIDEFVDKEVSINTNIGSGKVVENKDFMSGIDSVLPKDDELPDFLKPDVDKNIEKIIETSTIEQISSEKTIKPEDLPF
jgi:hypothetical protein